MIPYITLDVCIDSESINSISQSSKVIVHRLLLYHNKRCSCYNFVRSAYDSSPNIVSEIPEIQYSKSQEDGQKVEMIAKNALKKSRLSEGEKSFLLFIYNYSGLSQTGRIMDTDHNTKDKLFVTENEDILSRCYSLDRKVSLESFFPGIRLVNLHECLEIMDLFAKTQNLFLRSPNTNTNMDKGYWYWIYFRWNITHYNVTMPKLNSLEAQNDILNALGKRICHLLIAVDELGKLHYLKEDEIMMLYHFNYLVSLISGIFDNLAIHIRKIQHNASPEKIPIGISLKNNGGKIFLDEVQKNNIELRDHIRKHGDFIKLIDKFRQRVIHARGLKEIGFFFDFKMHYPILIDSDINRIISSCGDRPGPYKKLSEWGVYDYVPVYPNHFYLDRYSLQSLQQGYF
jgi:hypothetical protein